MVLVLKHNIMPKKWKHAPLACCPIAISHVSRCYPFRFGRTNYLPEVELLAGVFPVQVLVMIARGQTRQNSQIMTMEEGDCML